MRRHRQNLLTSLSLSIFFLFQLAQIGFAAPYFYITGSSTAVGGVEKQWPVYLHTDSQTVTAAQTVINYSTTRLTGVRISNLGSRCSFWAPADPGLGLGSSAAPYFSNGKGVISCGFSNPGYTTSGNASLIATLVFEPEASGSGTLTFSNTSFRYIASTVAAGSSPSFDYTVYESTQSANSANPTATPSPTTAGSSSSGSTSTIISDPEYTLDEDDLTFVEVSTTTTNSVNSTNTSTSDITLEAVDDDDSIPSVPLNITIRPTPSPYVFPEGSFNAASSSAQDDGDVLSVSSLRELLIPGKSTADKTVVLINFVSTLTFIVLLAIAVWRMITISKMNKVKYKHMQEILTGELSALQSKIGVIDQTKNPEQTKEIKSSFDELIDALQKEENQKKK